MDSVCSSRHCSRFWCKIWELHGAQFSCWQPWIPKLVKGWRGQLSSVTESLIFPGCRIMRLFQKWIHLKLKKNYIFFYISPLLSNVSHFRRVKTTSCPTKSCLFHWASWPPLSVSFQQVPISSSACHPPLHQGLLTTSPYWHLFTVITIISFPTNLIEESYHIGG